MPRVADFTESILDHITQGIIFIDSAGIITTYNRAAEEILGIPAKVALKQSFWDHFKDGVFGFSMRQALKTEHAETTLCIAYSTPHQQINELEVSTAFLSKNPTNGIIKSLKEGRIQGIILMIKDMTEIRHLQNLASRTDRMKVLGEMAAHVAHEIRNPLGGIKGFASLLQRDLASNPQLQQMATHIIEGTDDLNRLVSQILHYARPMQPHLEKVDLLEVLQELKEHFLADSGMQKQKVDVEIRSSVSRLEVTLDLVLFKSAILNLLVNAVQAMPQGGLIVISVEKKINHITLQIADTGIGISEENIAKLYSPFFTTKPEGNGLGLSEVQKVIQVHGGTIDVNSTLGSGTTFIIKLPINQRST